MKVKWVYYAYRKKTIVWILDHRRQEDRTSCPYCGCNYTAIGNRQRTLDHVIPKSKGGKDRPSNIVFCCASCNRRKGSTDWWEFVNTSWLQQKRRTIRREQQATVV